MKRFSLQLANTAGAKNSARLVLLLIISAVLVIGLACSKDTPAAPGKAPVTLDPDVFEADHPELFKTAKAESHQLPTVVTSNGTVSPDVNRTIHVTSLGAGRVVDLKVKLGDSVKKGETLLVISSPDLASAFSDYEKAKADEVLAKKSLDRAQMLFDRGAIAAKDLEVARTRRTRPKSMSRPRIIAFAYSAEIRRI